METLTRSQKLFYSFLLAGCFLTVAAFDDGAEQAEQSRQHAEWIAELNAKQLLEQKEEMRPQMVSEPQFVGRPNYNKQFAMLRAEHEARKAVK